LRLRDLSAPPLFSENLANDVGLPIPPRAISAEEQKYWNNLDKPAEDRLIKLYPCLEQPPSTIYIPAHPLSPFRLYRQIVPPKLAACNDNSLIFLSNYSTGQVPRTSEIYALWGVAYLENLLPSNTKATLLDKHQMDCDIALNEAYRKKRFLSAHPVRLSVAETSEHDENVLGDLGLRNDRKRMKMPNGWKGWFGLKAWWAEWFEPYFPEEYAGIVEEFLEQIRMRNGHTGFSGDRRSHSTQA
jgi:dimethylaniline monooxygenase (N-oxide forming)